MGKESAAGELSSGGTLDETDERMSIQREVDMLLTFNLLIAILNLEGGGGYAQHHTEWNPGIGLMAQHAGLSCCDAVERHCAQ